MIQIDTDMPEKCGLCPLFHAEHPMYCQGVKADRKKKIVAPYRDPRPEWCPLNEVTADPDTVSRKAVLDAMNTITKWSLLDRNGYHVGVGMKYRDVKETVKNLPPSQPTNTPLHDNGSDYAHGFADGYKQGLKDAESERVRCKECTFYRSDGCFFSTAETEENGFCSWAERKTDE